MPIKPVLDDPGQEITSDVNLVTPGWLAAHLKDVAVLDVSWYLPADNRKPAAEFLASRIPGAQFVAIEEVVAPTHADTKLPFLLPSPDTFAKAMSVAGVTHGRPVVVYDTKGLFSAGRAWFMLRMYGHTRVAVLAGGFPRWVKEGYPVAKDAPDMEAARCPPAPLEEWRRNDGMVRQFEQVVANAKAIEAAGGDASAHELVVDARPPGRFTGADPEPNPKLSSGHIPYSRNIPFSTMVGPNGELKDEADLRKIFADAGVDPDDKRTIVGSCALSMTANIVLLALAQLGRPLETMALSDGSWTTYATLGGPIVKGPA